jgi:hypothetical protein
MDRDGATILRLSACAALAATAGLAAAAPAWAGDGHPACAAADKPYESALQALTAGDGTELTIRITPATDQCSTPQLLKKVQLKTYSIAGALVDVLNQKDVAAPGGVATIVLPPLERGQEVDAKVLVQTGETVHTEVLPGPTKVFLRPDLAVTRVLAPRSALTGRSFAVEADIAELNGDVGAGATATLLVNGKPEATREQVVPAGGHWAPRFEVALADPGSARLEVTVTGASPRESNVSNNAAGADTEATEFELNRENVLVPGLSGYGMQLNQHVYSKLSMPPVTEENVLEMEGKMRAVDAQLVRIFFNTSEWDPRFPDRMTSFVRTVLLAQSAGATINVTFQNGGVNADIARFAGVLIDLVKNRHVTNLRWVTIQNEPNSTSVTPAINEAHYRQLDALLKAAGVRDQIRFMGGDLVAANQRVWFDYMAEQMADLLDAWSIHVFWDYWDTAKLQDRLREVRAIWDAEPEAGRKPLYVMEYGVRGIKTFNGVAQVDPGVWADGIPITRTNINAFQHAWFTILSSRLGYRGDVKWDSYWGKYDNGTQAYYMIGSPLDGWPVYPVYHATRLLTETSRPGWRVLGVDGPDAPKLLTSYAGPAGELSIVGLDTDGASLNQASPLEVPYSIGGLPPLEPFRLLVWNADGTGGLTSSGSVVADAAGVAQVQVPLSAAFALTTIAPAS